MPGNSRTATGCLSLKQIQDRIETEADEAKSIIQPLLDTEKTFVKLTPEFCSHSSDGKRGVPGWIQYLQDLDNFLWRWEALELRRKELLHRHWTQNIWNPTQKRIEQHVLSRLSKGPHRMRVMLEQYLKYCNMKGFVFLDNYDPLEYYPFERHINRQCYSKVPDSEPEDPPLPQLQDRMKEQRGFLPNQTGHVYHHTELQDPHGLHLPPIPQAVKVLSSRWDI